MPDLDQLVEAVVSDVRKAARAPGALAAIGLARRRRRGTVVLAGAAVALVTAVSSVLVVASRDGADSSAPIGEPSESVSVAPEAPVGSYSESNRRVGDLLGAVPGWEISGRGSNTYWTCRGGRLAGTVASIAGRIDMRRQGVAPLQVDSAGFLTATAASAAVERLVDGLESCRQSDWRARPIPGTGSYLATTSGEVAWIVAEQTGVIVVHAPTRDGLPPVDLQVEVAQQLQESLRLGIEEAATD